MSHTETDVLQVLSPLSGWCESLDDNPDEVFRNRMLGDGASIDPTLGEVRAPFSGSVLTVPESRHAINLRADSGAEFLIHIGVDTVALAGEGFQAHVAPGDRIDAGQLLLTFDLDRVLRGARSLRTPVLLLQSDQFLLEGDGPPVGPIEHGEPLYRVRQVAADASAPDDFDAGEKLSRKVAVGLEHGIHARPAAVLGDALKSLQARVHVSADEGPPAVARSAVALMSLGITRGDTVEVLASGPNAQEALEAVCGLLEPLDAVPEDRMPEREPAPALVPPPDGTVIRAQAASPGLGSGSAFLVQTSWETEYSAAGTPGEERGALEGAVARVRDHLEKLVSGGEGTGAEIAAAHLALLDDPLVQDGAEAAIIAGAAAPIAWRKAVDQAITTLRRADDRRMLERIDDLEDINLRVQRALAGQDPAAGPDIPAGSVLLADNMLPSQLLEVDRRRIAGICLSCGGATSHVALLAASLNIPMLVAAGPQVLAVTAGSPLLLDAELGELHICPDEQSTRVFRERVKQDAELQAIERAEAHKACHTTDGVRIHINANIASAEDAAAAVLAGAEGSGLMRTEFVFMERRQPPGRKEQTQIYQAVSDALGDRPMVVRTLDAGGDKPIAYLDQPAEENPALGIRGIRLCQQSPELLRTQLQALLQVERTAPLQIMIPMISAIEEVLQVRTLLDELKAETAPSCDARLGVMIETPAAALIADRLAEAVDFFSIGTNDLTQYTLCMDRGEPALASRLDVLHPAVLALVARTVEAADGAGIDVAICGGAAGDMLAAPVLLGLGVRELSMPASLVPRQKARLRKLSVEACRELADQALAMVSAVEVRALAREFVTAHEAPETGE